MMMTMVLMMTVVMTVLVLMMSVLLVTRRVMLARRRWTARDKPLFTFQVQSRLNICTLCSVFEHFYYCSLLCSSFQSLVSAVLKIYNCTGISNLAPAVVII